MKTGGLIAVGLGAIGLGALAVVVLKKPKTAEPGTAPAQPGLPGLPGAPPPPGGGAGPALVFVSDASGVHLKQGQYYRGRALLSSLPLFPFNLEATEEQIGKGLSALGFADVRVYMNVSNLPSDWPRETAQGTQAGTRWFQGQWTGPTTTVPLPRDLLTKKPIVEQVWMTASPSLVAQRASVGGGIGAAVMTG